MLTHFPRLSKRMMEASSLSSPMSSNFYDSHDQDMSSVEDIANLEKDIVKLLPPLSEAFHLCEAYLENGKHMSVSNISTRGETDEWAQVHSHTQNGTVRRNPNRRISDRVRTSF